MFLPLARWHSVARTSHVCIPHDPHYLTWCPCLSNVVLQSQQTCWLSVLVQHLDRTGLCMLQREVLEAVQCFYVHVFGHLCSPYPAYILILIRPQIYVNDFMRRFVVFCRKNSSSAHAVPQLLRIQNRSSSSAAAIDLIQLKSANDFIKIGFVFDSITLF